MEEEYILEYDEALAGSPFKQAGMVDGLPIQKNGISAVSFSFIISDFGI
jgi:hypothetical protein